MSNDRSNGSGVSAEQVAQWHLDYFDGKYKYIPRSEAAEFIAKRAYAKGLEDAAKVCGAKKSPRDTMYNDAYDECAEAICNLPGAKQ